VSRVSVCQQGCVEHVSRVSPNAASASTCKGTRAWEGANAACFHTGVCLALEPCYLRPRHCPHGQSPTRPSQRARPQPPYIHASVIPPPFSLPLPPPPLAALVLRPLLKGAARLLDGARRCTGHLAFLHHLHAHLPSLLQLSAVSNKRPKTASASSHAASSPSSSAIPASRDVQQGRAQGCKGGRKEPFSFHGLVEAALVGRMPNKGGGEGGERGEGGTGEGVVEAWGLTRDEAARSVSARMASGILNHHDSLTGTCQVPPPPHPKPRGQDRQHASVRATDFPKCARAVRGEADRMQPYWPRGCSHARNSHRKAHNEQRKNRKRASAWVALGLTATAPATAPSLTATAPTPVGLQLLSHCNLTSDDDALTTPVPLQQELKCAPHNSSLTATPRCNCLTPTPRTGDGGPGAAPGFQ
jgi:hypothetical protein